jgi:signal transduction histidine kinase
VPLAKTLRSSTFRRALISIALFGTTVVALVGYVYFATTSYVRGRADLAISAEHNALERAFASGSRAGLIAAIAQDIADQRFAGFLYLLAGQDFAPLAGNLKAWPPALQGAAGWDNLTAGELKSDASPPLPLRVTFTMLPDGTHLLVGRDVENLDNFVRKIDIALALTGLLIVLLAGVASVQITHRTVGRIEAINATSRAIMQSGLGQRIPLRGTRDEWDELAANLNSMLDRIEALVTEIRQFTDNVAHDLRTPLTRIRGRLERASAGNGQFNTALLGNTIADLDAVLAMFASLTRISQIEASDRTAAFRRIDLTEMARDVVELFDAAAEDKGGHVEAAVASRVEIAADRDLLFDALANLVDNAIKHGRDGGRVLVSVSESESGAVIAVADEGPGIPLQERDRVFKRFYRLERSRQTPGNGLGLSLVAAVARLHGASIEMREREPGFEFRLIFPGSETTDTR